MKEEEVKLEELKNIQIIKEQMEELQEKFEKAGEAFIKKHSVFSRGDKLRIKSRWEKLAQEAAERFPETFKQLEQ